MWHVAYCYAGALRGVLLSDMFWEKMKSESLRMIAWGLAINGALSDGREMELSLHPMEPSD